MIRRQKYGARPTESQGQRFPSLLEAHTYAHLCVLQSGGLIADLVRQPRVLLCCDIRWAVDFAFTDCDTGVKTFAESKGFEVPDYVLKRKLWTAFGLGPLWIFKRSGQSIRRTETIIPDRAKLGRDDLRLVSTADHNGEPAHGDTHSRGSRAGKLAQGLAK